LVSNLVNTLSSPILRQSYLWEWDRSWQSLWKLCLLWRWPMDWRRRFLSFWVCEDKDTGSTERLE